MPDIPTANGQEFVQRLQQQKAALAEFGVEAFRNDDLDALLSAAAVAAGEGLCVERAKVMELLPTGNSLLVRAGVGWKPDVVGRATIDSDRREPAGYALLMRTGRFRGSGDRRTLHLPRVAAAAWHQSAVNVIIGGHQVPFGVLEVDSQQPRHFTPDDINFLQGFANLLAAAIDRLKTHRRLAETAHQNEVLLHELQHRVKNSLQLITSFIGLQRRKTPHEQARDELDVVAGRIEALRAVYDKLYLADHHGEIDFGSYLEELCENLLQLQLAEQKAVRLDPMRLFSRSTSTVQLCRWACSPVSS